MITNIRIKESPDKLKELLSKEKNRRIRERVHALYLIKTTQVIEAQELAKVMAKNRTSITRWLNLYREGGLKSLMKPYVPKGRKPKIEGEILDRLIEKLGNEKGFGSIDEIRNWLKDKFDIDCSYKEVHHTVHNKLGAKPKVVRPTNPKKDKVKVEDLKKNSRKGLVNRSWSLHIKK